MTPPITPLPTGRWAKRLVAWIEKVLKWMTK